MPMCPEMEPLMPGLKAIESSDLPDLALDLERKAATLAGMLAPVAQDVIEGHMRVINSYYSNLIEGNRTQPWEIEKAMQGDYSDDPVRRDLQLESVAHIRVQESLSGLQLDPQALVSSQAFHLIHQQFYEAMPESLRSVLNEKGEVVAVVEPGVFRRPDQPVIIGAHLPPSGEGLENCMARFAEVYRPDRLKGWSKVIGAMAAHHRFAWIHPYIDGNGRVGRLHTDLFLKSIGIGACGIWCLSRGLARNNPGYRAALARADQPRHGDTDGRGALSESGLVEFCTFMLKTAIDQVEYMQSVLGLQKMGARITAYVEDRNRGLVGEMVPIKPEAARLLEKAFLFGEFPRAEMSSIAGLSLSVTRKLVQQLKADGLLTETSSRSPLRWAIPEHAARYYLPDLAPTRFEIR